MTPDPNNDSGKTLDSETVWKILDRITIVLTLAVFITGWATLPDIANNFLPESSPPPEEPPASLDDNGESEEQNAIIPIQTQNANGILKVISVWMVTALVVVLPLVKINSVPFERTYRIRLLLYHILNGVVVASLFLIMVLLSLDSQSVEAVGSSYISHFIRGHIYIFYGLLIFLSVALGLPWMLHLNFSRGCYSTTILAFLYLLILIILIDTSRILAQQLVSLSMALCSSLWLGSLCIGVSLRGQLNRAKYGFWGWFRS